MALADIINAVTPIEKADNSLPELKRNHTRVPGFPSTPPTAEQQDAIRRWRLQINTQKHVGRFSGLGVFGDYERSRIASMSVDDFAKYLGDVRTSTVSHISVNLIPEGCALTAEDPALRVVRHIGERVYWWLHSRNEVIAAMETLDALIKIHKEGLLSGDEIDKKAAERAFYRAARKVSAKRRTLTAPLLHKVVGTSRVVTPREFVVVDENGGIIPPDAERLKKMQQQFRNASRLIPDSFKTATLVNTEPLVVGYMKGTAAYRRRSVWTDWNNTQRCTPVIHYSLRESSLVHEMMHRMQHAVPTLRVLESRFLQERCGDNPPIIRQRDNDRTKEIMFPGGFVSTYVGKVYGDGFREVLTTGMEMLFYGKHGAGIGAGLVATESPYAVTDPETGRIKADLDHLHFTLGVLFSAPLGY